MLALISPIAYVKPFAITICIFVFIMFAVFLMLQKTIATKLLSKYDFIKNSKSAMTENPFSQAYSYGRNFLIGFVPMTIILYMLIQPREVGVCILALLTIPLSAYALIELAADYAKFEKMIAIEKKTALPEVKKEVQQKMKKLYLKSKSRWVLGWISFSASLAVVVYATNTFY